MSEEIKKENEIKKTDETKKKEDKKDLDKMIEEMEKENTRKQNGKEDNNNKKDNNLNLTVEQVIEIGARIIEKTYADVGKVQEGKEKAHTYRQINNFICMVIPVQEGLNKLKVNSFDMSPKTALLIGGASVVISAIVMILPARKQKKQLKAGEKNG